MPEVDRTIGRYDVLRQIGRGGMAVVHLARQSDLQRFVALKELRALHDDDPAYARRFLREARLAGSLTDANVVTVYEYLEHEGTPYLAMEYLERGSLRPYVGEMNLPQVAGVLEGLLSGLVAAERQDIVHRDLKPENVLVTADGRVKIADFGIAKATNALQTGGFQTATGMTVGTPAYIAPEQAMSEEIGPWTDLYSVGCIAFELFTGERPFNDVESPVAILMRHVTHPIPPVTSIAPDVDERISDWVARLLVKDAAERTRSASQAWEEFEEIAIALLGARWRRDARLLAPAAGGEPEPEYRTYTEDEPPEPPVPVTARPYTPPPPDLPAGPMAPPPEPVELPRRSRRWPAIAAVSAVLVVAGLAAFFATRGDDEEPASPPAAGNATVIPAGNLVANPSFERDTGGWDGFQSKLSREPASDAPDGEYVARVTLDVEPEEYSIDDEPDVLEQSVVAGTEYVAVAWVKATPETNDRPVCISIREWTPGREEGVYTGKAEGSVTATTAEYRKVEVRYVAEADENTIGVHVYRYPGEMEPGESFLVDAITMTERTSTGPNTQLVDDTTCGA